MDHVFWLLPGALAGRAGPDRVPWRLGDFRRAGIGAVLSVNDGELCHLEEFETARIAYECIPLSDSAPPQGGDRERCQAALPRAFEFVRHNVESGIATLVHCSAGKDRTGLFMAHYLVHAHGCTPEDAIARVRTVRPIAFTAEGWEQLAFQVLRDHGG